MSKTDSDSDAEGNSESSVLNVTPTLQSYLKAMFDAVAILAGYSAGLFGQMTFNPDVKQLPQIKLAIEFLSEKPASGKSIVKSLRDAIIRFDNIFKDDAKQGKGNPSSVSTKCPVVKVKSPLSTQNYLKDIQGILVEMLTFAETIAEKSHNYFSTSVSDDGKKKLRRMRNDTERCIERLEIICERLQDVVKLLESDASVASGSGSKRRKQ